MKLLVEGIPPSYFIYYAATYSAEAEVVLHTKNSTELICGKMKQENILAIVIS